MVKVFFIALFCFSLIFCFGESVFAQAQHQHQTEKAAKLTYGLCPVAGTEASGQYSHTYENKIYYFCCEDCVRQFIIDPQRYISRIKEFKLEAYQYGFSPDPLIVKKGDIIKLEITSRDVPHGVYIKEYGINVKVEKAQAQRVEFLADKVGNFDILCSVYCGSGHTQMKGKLIVKQ